MCTRTVNDREETPRVAGNAVNDFMSWLFGMHERAWLLRRWLM
jgi:hypothetical protein